MMSLGHKELRVIIYESSSFGGCYEYALQLYKHYGQHTSVISCQLLLPKNVQQVGAGIVPFLLEDGKRRNKFWSKLSFLYRHLVNPLLLVFFLRKQPSSFVLLNDFEQLSAWIWVPLLRFWSGHHTLGVFLHDPDRDEYPPSKKIASASMRKMLSIMDLALYHEVLPDKSYYKNVSTQFINVPHGLYQLPDNDAQLTSILQDSLPVGSNSLLLLGAIRLEKNIDLAIQSLPYFEHLYLIIAGSASTSTIDLDYYRDLASDLNVSNRIIWITKYLSPAEMASCIVQCDMVWLNYAASFKSQSAIFNTIALFKKKVLVSDTHSSMSIMARKFRIGELIEPDNLKATIHGIQQLLTKSTNHWDDYLQYASWSAQVQLVVDVLDSHKNPIVSQPTTATT